MRTFANLFCITAVICTAGCTRFDNPLVPEHETPEKTASLSADPGNTEEALKEFARILARANEDGEVLKMLHEAIGKKFDGQYEVLYNHIKHKKGDKQTTFRMAMKSARKAMKSDKSAFSAMSLDDLTARLDEVMNLHIFMPYYDRWDGITPPLVAFVPQVSDDGRVESIEAFDSRGKVTVISGENAEQHCYIVVGANERTDADGALSADLIWSEDKNTPAADDPWRDEQKLWNRLAKSLTGRPDNYRLRFYRLGIYDDHEPYFFRGDPEISVTFSSPETGTVATYNFDGRFDLGYTPGNWIYFGYTIIWWHEETYGSALGFLVYERDGGSPINLSFGFSAKSSEGVNVNGNIRYVIEDGDDQLYQGTIGWHDPYPTEYRNTDARLMINSIP